MTGDRPAAPSGRLRRLGHLAGWSVVSQAASAASNSAVELGLALFGGVTVLGSWALYYAGAQTMLYLVRAAASEPLLAEPSPPGDLAHEPRAGAYLTVVTAVALPLGAAVGVAAAITGSPALAFMALAVPALLVQDGLRYLCFWALRPRTAAAVDLVWLAVSAGGILVIRAHPTESTAVAVWAAGAAASGVVGAALVRPRARTGALAWWQGVRRLALATTTDTAMYLASNQWLWFWMSATAGSAALGAYRVAALVANPVMLLFLASQTLIIPGVARRGHIPRRALAYLAGLPFVGAAATAVLAAAFTVVARHTGVAGDDVALTTWLAAGLFVMAGGLAGPVAALMRGLRHGRQLVVSRAASTALTVASAAVLVPAAEATGLFLSQAGGQAAFAAGCGPALRRSGAHGGAAGGPVTAADGPGGDGARPDQATSRPDPSGSDPRPGPAPTL